MQCLAPALNPFITWLLSGNQKLWKKTLNVLQLLQPQLGALLSCPMTHLFYFYFVLFLLTFPLLRHFFICAHMHWITSLRNRTGEERRMWALCDKCDNNFVKITVAKVHFHLNRSFCKQPGNINVILSEDHDKTSN